MFRNLSLDADTGHIRWTAGGRNGHRAGTKDKYGYRIIHVDGKQYYAHRIAWHLFHGKWPEGSLDHINGDKDDNRLVNLREACTREQSRNKPMPSNNKSGVVGVFRDKPTGRWRACIGVDGDTVYLGLFDDLSLAIEARSAAEKKYGFHANHGRAQQ